MVLLTMTPAIVRALAKAAEASPEDFAKLQQPSEPALADAKAGNPISHSQLIDLSKLLKMHSSEDEDENEAADEDRCVEENADPTPTTLDAILRGSKIYIPPPPPKTSPTPAPKKKPAPTTSFPQRFPHTLHFSLGADIPASQEDELSYEEVHRQVILIINVIVSIVACAVFVWVAARHWSVPKRLGLSMGSSGAVAIAEVVVYSGYVRKVEDAKRKEKKKPEIKEIVQSWVIEGKSGKVDISSSAKEKAGDGVRYRKGKHR
ncbi:hypothetical protein K458DRAFT_440578 [Lentithecium fluviatile CBS 122367]|uniref:Uncharacterized protein n=1 Tax=Lentithecium fluviatile CBS 122367 TaxID=1168545 RepID=A0A6G1JB67_9PLEO|nr:hypothetical protein K458DRAFT_440578 [Lentithecium fluviatile CBS 122367]